MLDRVKLLTGEGYAAARGRAAPKGGSSVMGGQLGLLGHMGPSTVVMWYCSTTSTLGFVRDKIRSLRVK